jgi:autotransporter translocation and assembly factor TamB
LDDTPILFRGAPQGRVTGNTALHLTREEGQMLVDVDVPTLKLRLPESSARSVIDVADNSEIVILQNQVQEKRRSEALPWSLLVHLGNQVSIHRSDIELKVTGTPIVSLGYLTQVGGSVELVPGGRLPVLGQVIERGLVTFDTGVPENPTVNVTAVWRAPNDTLVYVEVTGTLREAEVALRSDPPMPEAEVFALLFGGGATPDNATAPGTNTGSSAAGAAALQGPVQQLNRLFGQSPVELRVGSTAESRSRYTAAVRVRENLWFEASTYQQSEYVAGGSTQRNVVSGTIDYRFTRKWSLRTEAGTAGGALDLLWQHRY